MGKFVHIRSSKFPILPGEEEELVNEGMYGKALCQYLQTQLQELGYDAPYVCCEDWGWWVELNTAPFTFGVCVYSSDEEGVYSGDEEDGMREFACTDGAAGSRKWSWKTFGFIDSSRWVDALIEDLISIFEADEEVEIVGVLEDFPELGSAVRSESP